MSNEADPPSSIAKPSPDSASWPLAARVGFRFLFTYLLLFIVSVSGAIRMLPWIGPHLQEGITFLWSHPVQWIAHSVVHLTGVAATAHSTDSRDTALDWIMQVVLIVTAMGTCLAWSLVDRRRREYRDAARWLRFAVRLTLIFLMFRYGLFKLFPLQMPSPSLAVLNEPVDATSPLALLWTMIGLKPGYEVLCGALETLAAILLVFRRTALAGVLLTIVLMTNVLFFNLFFDVPVKLGALSLLILALALLAPDFPALWEIFWRHRPAAPGSDWAPRAAQPWLRLTIRFVEFGFAAVVLWGLLPVDVQQWQMQQAMLHHPSPIAGAWVADTSLSKASADTGSGLLLTGEGQPMRSIYFERNGTVMIRSVDGRLWRGFAFLNDSKQTLTLVTSFGDDSTTYRISRPSPAHLVLTPSSGNAAILSLSKVPLPTEYPLIEHRMRWTSEWGYWM